MQFKMSFNTNNQTRQARPDKNSDFYFFVKKKKILLSTLSHYSSATLLFWSKFVFIISTSQNATASCWKRAARWSALTWRAEAPEACGVVLWKSAANWWVNWSERTVDALRALIGRQNCLSARKRRFSTRQRRSVGLERLSGVDYGLNCGRVGLFNAIMPWILTPSYVCLLC